MDAPPARESPDLISAVAGANTFELRWADGFTSVFHAVWLRDNCRCNLCGAHETGARQSRVADLPDDLAAASVKAEAGRLNVIWNDGHETGLSGAWLRAHAYDGASRKARAPDPPRWTNDVRRAPPRMDYAAVMRDDEPFLEFLLHVRALGLCFLDGAGDDSGRLEALARRIGPLQESNFGRVQDLIVDLEDGRMAQSAAALRPHTDEPYRASPPGVLMFHCLRTDTSGGAGGAGESLFADGFEIADALRAEDPEGFAALTRCRQPFRRHYKGDVDLIAAFPVLSADEFGRLCGVRINDRVAAPLETAPEDVAVYYRGFKRLAALAADERFAVRKTLSPGDIAVFDNHRVLHGRTELTITGRRWLQWASVDRGDLHSAVRVVSDRLGRPRDEAAQLRGAYG